MYESPTLEKEKGDVLKYLSRLESMDSFILTQLTCQIAYSLSIYSNVPFSGRGLRTSYSYDPASRPTGQQYQDGTRVTNTYDSNSQRTVLSDWTGSYTSTYDPDGRVSSLVNPAGLAITYGFDA